MNTPLKEEQSAGGVVYRQTGSKYEFLLGKHSGYHKWVLPKGMVEEGETLQQTAEREIFEEVGVRAQILDREPFKVIEYTYKADLDEVVNQNPHTEETTRRVITYQEQGGGSVTVHKKVAYFLMRLTDDSGEYGWEMEDRKWVSYVEGVELLAFDSEREVFQLAQDQLLGASDQS